MREKYTSSLRLKLERLLRKVRGEEIKRYLVTRWTLPQKYRRHVQMGVC